MKEAAAEGGWDFLFLVDGFSRNYDNLNKGHCLRLGPYLYIRVPQKHWKNLFICCACCPNRFRTFEQQTVPVVNTLREVQEILEQQENSNKDIDIASNSMALQVEDIKGDRTIDEVWTDTQSVMNKMLANDVWTVNAKLMKAIESNNVEQYRSLCAYLEKSEDMSTHEGDASVEISNATIEFETGTKAITSYDRVMEDGVTTRETRVWSHEGVKGWRCIHFYRTPKSAE
mmetsp:Transcript_13249/g.20199  ORF Transcript_13249/g.20199 Transcript_13249/m.20199 type:complete len:229 (+) Transcript_13249:169-855(+)